MGWLGMGCSHLYLGHFFALPIPAEVAIRQRTKPPKSLRPPYPNGAETAKFPGDCPGRSGAPR